MKTPIFAACLSAICLAASLSACGGSSVNNDVVGDVADDVSHNDTLQDTPDLPPDVIETDIAGADVIDIIGDTTIPDTVPTDLFDAADNTEPLDIQDVVVPDTSDTTIPSDTSDVSVCTPQCDGRECGPDGCGDWCGWCGEGKVCRDQMCADFNCGEGWTLIPAGQMNIPDPDNAGGPGWTVTMTRAFCMKDVEVTNADWLAIPEYKDILPSFDAAAPCLDCPVEQISWFEAVDYCNLLSKNSGKASCVFLKNESGLPCSRIPSTGRVTACKKGTPYDSVYMNCSGYRIPTRTEWLFAAMAGRWKSAFPGSGISDYAWNNSNAGGKKHSGALLSAMESGVYDIIGNVWEMVWDAAVEDLTVQPSGIDPTGAAIEGGLRLRMGGSFFSNPLMLWPPPVAVCSSESAGDLATGLRPVFTAQ